MVIYVYKWPFMLRNVHSCLQMPIVIINDPYRHYSQLKKIGAIVGFEPEPYRLPVYANLQLLNGEFPATQWSV